MTRTVARFGFLAVVVTVAGVLAAAIIPARAQTTTAADRRGGAGLPAGFRSWGQLFAEQEVLDRAAARVRAAAGAGSGYAGLRVDVIGHTLTVYWKGQPTAALTRTIAAVRTDRLHVTVVPARYAKAELDAQVASIASDAFTGNGDRVISIAAFADGSGIRVGVQRAAGPRAALAGGLPHLQQGVRSAGPRRPAVHPLGRALRQLGRRRHHRRRQPDRQGRVGQQRLRHPGDLSQLRRPGLRRPRRVPARPVQQAGAQRRAQQRR